MYLELIKRDNYSDWVRDACEDRLLSEGNGSYIDSKIKEYQDEIKKLKELKENDGNKIEEINNLLTHHAPAYQKNAEVRSNHQRLQFLEKSVMPKLKKLGCKQKVEEIDQILREFPIEGGN